MIFFKKNQIRKTKIDLIQLIQLINYKLNQAQKPAKINQITMSQTQNKTTIKIKKQRKNNEIVPKCSNTHTTKESPNNSQVVCSNICASNWGSKGSYL